MRTSPTILRSRLRPLVGLFLAASLTVVALPAAPALADGPTPAQIAALAATRAEAVAPGFFDTQTLPPLPDPVNTGDGEISFAYEQNPVTVGATTATGTPITINGVGYNLRRCAIFGTQCFSSVPNAVTPVSSNTSVLTTTGQSSVVVQSDENESRSLVVINDSSGATDYSWALTNGSFSLEPDGTTVVARDAAGEGIATVAAPWAVDANGATVPTHYTVSNGFLTLHVDHAGAAYPVIADPTISFGWYVYVRYSKSEVQSVWAKITSQGYSYVSVLCVKIPNGWVAGVCAAAIGNYTSSIANTIISARNNNRCLEMRVTYNGWLVGWRTYSC